MKDRNFWLVFFTIIVVLPLSLFRQLGALRFTSIFAIACISFVTLVAVIKYYEFRHLGYAPTIAYQLSHLPMFDFSMNHLLNAVPLVIFAYTCHPNVSTVLYCTQSRFDFSSSSSFRSTSNCRNHLQSECTK